MIGGQGSGESVSYSSEILWAMGQLSCSLGKGVRGLRKRASAGYLTVDNVGIQACRYISLCRCLSI